MIKYFTNNTFKTIKEMTKEELKTWETKLEKDLERNIKNSYIEENKRIIKELKAIKKEIAAAGLNRI